MHAKTILLLLITLALHSTATAGIMINSSGVAGSSEMTLSMSGSLDYDNLAININNATNIIHFPDHVNHSWIAPLENWNGNQLWDMSVGQVLLATSSTLKMLVSGDHSQTYTFDSILIGSFGDGFLLPAHSQFQGSYPALSNADVTISVSGSASFTLPNGLTFDNLMQGSRTSGFTYSGSVTQNVAGVNVASVPEPTSILMFCGMLPAIFLCRRRGKDSQRATSKPTGTQALCRVR